MLEHVELIDVFMCGFISFSINNEVNKSIFLYKIDQEKGKY